MSFDPAQGSEMKKTRPAVVISSDAVGTLPVRLVAPLTAWKSYFEKNLWHVRLSPTKRNGLGKESAADALQIRSVDVSRFGEKLGRIHEAELEEVTTAVAIVIEYR